MKRSLMCLAVLLTLVGCHSGDDGPKYPDMKAGKYVQDFADKIDDATEAKLEAKLSDLEKKTSIELAVVTVSSLRGEEPSAYATELGHRWEIGQKGKDNGIVFLWAPDERKVFIAVGYGLEDQLTDALTKVIVDNTVLPHFKKEDFNGGVTAGVDHLIATISGEKFQDSSSDTEKEFPLGTLILIFGVIIIMVVIVAALGGGSSGGSGGRRRRYYDSGSSDWSSGSSGGSSGGLGGGGDFGGGGAGGSY